MWTWALGILLIMHAFVHGNLRRFGPMTSWLLGDATAQPVSGTLSILAALGFAAAGIGLLLRQGWWEPAAVASSLISLLLLGVFWQRGLVIGAAVNLAVLITILWLRWPPQVFAGG